MRGTAEHVKVNSDAMLTVAFREENKSGSRSSASQNESTPEQRKSNEVVFLFCENVASVVLQSDILRRMTRS